MIDCLNLDILRNKFTNLTVILKYLSFDYHVLRETNLDERWDNGIEINSGEVSLSMNCQIYKRIAKYEPKYGECICSEITSSNKN